MVCRYTRILLFFLGIFAVVSVGAAGYYYRHKRSSFPDSLWETLDYYGFKQLKQKQALEFLLKKSGIIKPDHSLMETFPKRANKTLLLKDVLDFVAYTQESFTIRTGTQERWEVSPSRWMQENQEETLKALAILGLVAEKSPAFLSPDVICILGGRMSSMTARMEYASEFFNTGRLNAQYLVLLTGERRVTVGADGFEADLRQFAEKYQVDLAQLTETHLMHEVYSHSGLFNKLPTYVIDTPAGDLPRPTTETTTQQFCQWLRKHPNFKSVVFVSSQPNVAYQEAVIAEVFKYEVMDVNVKFEVIGPKVSPKVDVQGLIGALGSQIWAKTPSVLAEMGIFIRDPDLIDGFKKLYAKQPLIYKNIELLFPMFPNSTSPS